MKIQHFRTNLIVGTRRFVRVYKVLNENSFVKVVFIVDFHTIICAIFICLVINKAYMVGYLRVRREIISIHKYTQNRAHPTGLPSLSSS